MARLTRPRVSARKVQNHLAYLKATLVTCLVLAMLGGTWHVVVMGGKRMQDMRNHAAYKLNEEHSRIRGAGEDLHLNRANEAGQQQGPNYTLPEALALLSQAEWERLEQPVSIAAGTFIMGTNRVRADVQDKPSHKVDLPAYLIDPFPVTNAQYAVFVADTGHRPPVHWSGGRIPEGLARHPVTMVSWYDAYTYAQWNGRRLPTESEWEKAARGPKAYRWPWGDHLQPKFLNTYYRLGHTTPVWQFKVGVSSYGVWDMAGNVEEWTGSDFTPYIGTQANEDIFVPRVVTRGQALGEARVVDQVKVDAVYKVLRGGSWKSDPFSTSSDHRNFSWPQYASDFYGFRCAAEHPGSRILQLLGHTGTP